MNPDQQAASLEAMTQKNLGIREWLTYYRNLWTRNLTARMIDVETDIFLKKENAEQQVVMEEAGQARMVAVKVRLEHRKILVQDAVDLLTRIEELLSATPAKLMEKTSVEFLKVAEDMMPKKPATAFVSYKVLSDGVTLPNGEAIPNGSVVQLDPDTEIVKKCLGLGLIEEWKSPEAAAPAAEAAK